MAVVSGAKGTAVEDKVALGIIVFAAIAPSASQDVVAARLEGANALNRSTALTSTRAHIQHLGVVVELVALFEEVEKATGIAVAQRRNYAIRTMYPLGELERATN